jgi:hypothetical protein
MITSSEIFRRYNFLLLYKILDNGDNTIEAVCFTNPNNEIFNQPINKLKNDRNSRKSEVVRTGCQVYS